MNDNTRPPTPKEFWTSVWEEGAIRFHQQNYNAQMMHFFDSIDLKDKSVLIPLAGKTKDILYFLEKGAHVTAVEFYEGAVIDFFKENHLSYTREGNIFKGQHIHFHACDFFELKTSRPFDVMYDRASQVVFSKETRDRYYSHVATLIDKKTLLYLGAINHKGPDDYGPPYKISVDEVKKYYEQMGISLFVESIKKEVPSEKMQSFGILEFETYFLANNG